MPLRSEDEEAASKKPRWARNWALGCFSTLFLFGLIVAGYIAWASILPPPPPFPQAMMPSPNGYDAVLAVLPRVAAAPGNAEVSEGRISIEKLRPAVRQQKPYLDELRIALKLPFRNPPIKSAKDEGYIGPMAQYRQAARALAAEARVGLADGEAAKGWSSGLDALELGAKLHRGGVLIHHLVGVAACAIGTARIDGQAENLSADEARATRLRVERITTEVPPLAEILREEHRVNDLAFRKYVTDPPMLEQFDGEEVTWTEKAKRVGLRYFYPKAWSARELNKYWETATREAEKPQWQRSSPPEPTDPYLQEMFIDPLQFARFHTRLLAELDLLRLQLALREHRARFGAYPAALGELAKLGVKPLTDRFTGKPYVYRRMPSGYLLYSAGQNGTDDGGTPAARANPESGDLVAGKLFPNRQ